MRRSLALELLLLLQCVRGDRALELLDSLAEGDRSLKCSACEFVASTLQHGIDSKIAKGFKGWTAEVRRDKVYSSMKKACKRFDGMQVALMGEPGQRKIGNFNDFISKGGTLSNVNMTPESRKSVKKLCKEVARSHSEAMVETMAQSKRRVIDFNVRHELCERLLAACQPDDGDGMGDDDEDDDEDKDEP
jgi:hypothetical protein